jgi:biopolymer transport protein ExbD
MLLGKKKKDKDVEIPSASLSDIVFLLLIFFLVTTSIDTEKGLDLVLPEIGDDIEVSKKNLSNLLVNATGQVLLDGELLEVNEIGRIVKEKLYENELLIISVKTDKATKYETYVEVLDQLKKADARRISLAEPDQE